MCQKDSLCAEQIVKPLRTTTYKATVIDSNNCRATGEVTVKVDRSRPIFIPNVFSPNGEGPNEVFYIHANRDIIKTIRRFQIFDRWGELLFTRSGFLPDDPREGWDGRFKGREVPTGVYVYFTEIEFLDGLVEVFQGDITVVK
ncbi:MAG: gliding motility-associated C-terminal domain-containing protein [Saprospiraceae bacterium]|nr:gliding motility-associated C-terminal domain-containing protein [Saprospiraceae bacterium]